MPSCPNLAVPAEIMQHVANVESGKNAYAIGVVGARLQRQPQNLDEAVATAQVLEAQGYNFSLGVAQVNRYNLSKFGLNSYEKAFDLCGNLAAGSRILAQCYALAGGDWGKSFSCYYSGNFTKGFDDGYVQKVYASIHRASAPSSVVARAIPIQVAQGRPQTLNSTDYLVRMRSSAIDGVGASVASNLVQNLVPGDAQSPSVATFPTPIEAPVLASARAPAPPAADGIFEPEVHGPNDVVAPPGNTGTPPTPGVDRADLRRGGPDDAFVF